MLGLQDDDERVKARGSAIAFDHSLDVSFPPLATTAINRLHNIGGYCALFTICIDVGHDFAVALEGF